jgi:hypothetical protein
MTDVDRGEVLAALTELARRYPHWRLGQLVANVAGWADVDVWDVEDGQLLAAAREHLRTTTGGESNGPTSSRPQQETATYGSHDG